MDREERPVQVVKKTVNERGTIRVRSIVDYKVDKIVSTFSRYNEQWREIKDQLNSCWICEKKFSEGDSINLMLMHGTTNKVVCDKCAYEVSESTNRDIMITPNRGK